MSKYVIHVRDGRDWWVDDDYADNEADARSQAEGWTGQRGQMKWTATVSSPDGTHLATYKRGKEVET